MNCIQIYYHIHIPLHSRFSSFIRSLSSHSIFPLSLHLRSSRSQSLIQCFPSPPLSFRLFIRHRFTIDSNTSISNILLDTFYLSEQLSIGVPAHPYTNFDEPQGFLFLSEIVYYLVVMHHHLSQTMTHIPESRNLFIGIINSYYSCNSHDFTCNLMMTT